MEYDHRPRNMIEGTSLIVQSAFRRMLLDVHLLNTAYRAAALRIFTGSSPRHYRCSSYSEGAGPYNALLGTHVGKCDAANYPHLSKTGVWPMLPATDCMLVSRYEVAEPIGHFRCWRIPDASHAARDDRPVGEAGQAGPV